MCAVVTADWSRFNHILEKGGGGGGGGRGEEGGEIFSAWITFTRVVIKSAEVPTL